MPFDEEDDKQDAAPKIGLKKVSSQKSIFEEQPKKPTAKDLQERVKQVEQNAAGYKKRAAELTVAFKRAMVDKTLSQNRNVFMQETDQEMLTNMAQLSQEVNNDPNEQEGIGSLMWIVLLFKTCLAMRDRCNNLEYELSQLKNKVEPTNLKNIILPEIRAELDKKKSSE